MSDKDIIQWESGTYPNCTTAEEFKKWKAANRKDNVSFCRDCTPEYQARMIAENRCDFPNVRFVMRYIPSIPGDLYELVGTLQLFEGEEEIKR